MKINTISWPPQLAMSYLGSGDLENQNKETLSSGEATLAGKMAPTASEWLLLGAFQISCDHILAFARPPLPPK